MNYFAALNFVRLRETCLKTENLNVGAYPQFSNISTYTSAHTFTSTSCCTYTESLQITLLGNDLVLFRGIKNSIPVQLIPFPVNPDWQVHDLLPAVFLHMAWEWQPPLFDAHSSISMSIQNITLNALDHIPVLTLELNQKWRPPPSQISVRWHLWSRYPIQSYHLYLRAQY